MTNEEFVIGVMFFGLVCGVVFQLGQLRAKRKRQERLQQEQIEQLAHLTDRIEAATFNRSWYGAPGTPRKAKREKPDDTSHGTATYLKIKGQLGPVEWSRLYEAQPPPERTTPTEAEWQEIRRKPPERPIFNNGRPDTTGIDWWDKE